MIKKGKTRITVTLSNQSYNFVKEMSKATKQSKSTFIQACIEAFAALLIMKPGLEKATNEER